MELSFATLLEQAHIPAPETEYRFCDRRWRMDFAWRPQMVYVEIDGGQWMAGGGRHNTDADRDKCNTAAALGWRGLHFSHRQLAEEPDRCVELVRLALFGTSDGWTPAHRELYLAMMQEQAGE